MTFFKTIENSTAGTSFALADVLDQVPFDDKGLVPAIAQDAESLEVLMLAWMDRKAIQITLDENRACYYSRSRKTYWRKGEESGHVQHLVEMRIDCDGDAILLLVNQVGAACHTNRPNCFYLIVNGDTVVGESNA